MDLIILDKNFDTLGSVRVFNSLIWTSRYYDTGIFELHAPADAFELLNTGKYLYRNDRDNLGVIREVNFARDKKGAQTTYCKGYFAEDLLNARVINAQQRLTGKIDAVGQALVKTFFINPSDQNRKISNIKLGKLIGLGDSITLTATGDSVGEKLYEIEKTQEMSHRLVYDYLTNDLIFETWKGKDRTDLQTENSWAIFSNSFYNVKNAQYNRDSSSYRNYAYVAGEGEGDARTVVSVDLRESPEEERRELYVDARDLQRTYTDDSGAEHTYTEAQYLEVLRQRGLEKLAEYEILEKIDSDVDPQANLVYRKDFDLGDLCTFRYTDVGIECTKRITEVQETYEGGKQTLSVVFGAGGATTITKLIKRETT